MKLKLKEEYLEWSINSGGRSIKRKLKNVHPSEFEKLYNLGYREFFSVVDDNSKDEGKKPIKNEIKEKKEDDLNKSAGV